MSTPVIVLKLGGSVLRDERALPEAVHELYRAHRRGAHVVAVVSALAGETDALFAAGRRIGPLADDEVGAAALAALVATGEARAAALLGLALERAGLHARVLDPLRAGLRTSGGRLDATPADLDPRPFREAFAAGRLVVLPGFVGQAADGGAALLGRGGSDLSTLFVARELGARECVLLKDVDGIHERDPAADPGARRYAQLRFEDALKLDGSVLQQKATRFAAEHGLAFELRAIGSTGGTRVGAARTLFAGSRPTAAPTRVALAGLGAVGLGVFRALRALPTQFEVVSVAARHAARAGREDVPDELYAGDGDELLARAPDVLVELVGGQEPARGWIARALSRGVDVVTANKALIAERGVELDALSRASGARLLRSASVGGALPAIEAVRRAARRGGLTAFEGVLNGTTSFVLDRLSGGAAFADAVREAQARGFAEADPARDLDGRDVADKLRVLVRELGLADGVGRELCWGRCEGLETLELDPARGRQLRLLARARLDGSRVHAAVELRELQPDHPLAGTAGAGNALELCFADGRRELWSGAGAGRWPTTEAVLADLMDLRRRQAVLGERAEVAA